MLYGHDLSGWVPEGDDLNWWRREDRFYAGQAPQRFAWRLYRGILEHLGRLDEMISQVTEHWALGRVTPVDRNLLRLGVYEILYRPDIPDRATLNDLIELAKVYGDEESSRFINGVLDAILRSKEADDGSIPEPEPSSEPGIENS